MTWLKENWLKIIIVLLIAVFVFEYFVLSTVTLNVEKKKVVAEYCSTLTTTLPNDAGRLAPSEKQTRNFCNLDQKC